MSAELLARVKEYEEKVASLKPKKELKGGEDGTPAQKWKKEDHPAFRKTTSATPVPATDEPKTWNIGDNIMAKYSADKTLYPATIVGAMGPAQNRIYTVRFKGYTGTETIGAHAIRAVPSSTTGAQKRKADGSPIVSTNANPTLAAPPTNNGSVMSAPANINAELASAMKKEPSKVSDGPARPEKAPKKIKGNKALENAKNSWQSWQSKAGTGKASKVVKKDSMFRTGEGANARGRTTFIASAVAYVGDMLIIL